MRIELKPSFGRLAELDNARFMAFDADEANSAEKVYGLGATYEDALKDFLKRLGNKMSIATELMSRKITDFEEHAVQMNNDFDNESTAWIFEDGSAVIACSDGSLSVDEEYGLHCDYVRV